MAKYLIIAVLMSLVVSSGCALQEDAVRKRATFDLDCPKEKLQVQTIGTYTYGVRGCDRKASYLCPNGGTQCVLNSLDGETGVKK